MNLPLNIDYVNGVYVAGNVTTPEGTINCFVRHVADLVLPTGRIVACDPLVFFDDAAPFTAGVSAGTYPVMLGVAEFENGDQRIAFAKLQFSAAEVSTWQMALSPGDDLSTLGPDQFFGYPVDSGTGCFMDEAAAATLRKRMSEDDEYYQIIIDEMEKTSVNTWSHANMQLSPLHNCIVFSSGWGDGSYASYFGYSSATEPVCLVTDFDVLPR